MTFLMLWSAQRDQLIFLVQVSQSGSPDLSLESMDRRDMGKDLYAGFRTNA